MADIDPKLITREALHTWLLEFHESTARLNAQIVTDKFFTDDIESQYANNPVAKGKEAVAGFFTVAFNALDQMRHEIKYFDFVAPNKIYQAATISYVVKGDDPNKDTITIPASMTAWLVQDGGRLKFQKNEIYLDPSALFSRMQQKNLI